MRKSYRFLTAWLIAGLFSLSANAQTVTITGKVSNGASKESVPAVSITVKGTSLGTYTNSDGEFSIRVAKLPVVLQFSSIGFDNLELTVSDASNPVNVDLKVNSELGQEVVIAATRTPTRILESPVTIERMNKEVIRSLTSPTVYEGMGHIKGVDVHNASLTFLTVTTRGFVSSGNTRLNQLVDGMDNQAPGLNFSVSSIVGLTDLDVDNVEILSGASSALYGSGGMNGTVLISSKNPFEHQGLSYNIKQGIMHVDGKQRNAAPYYNWTFRYARAFKNRIAYKLSAELIKGNDWQADDYRNKGQIGILSAVKAGNRQNDPNYNGINVYGDETDINMDAFSYYVQDQTRRALLAASGGAFDIVTFSTAYWNAQGNPVYPTTSQRDAWAATIGGILGPQGQAAALQMWPFYNGLKNAYYRNTNVSRTGYLEKDLVDYNTLNVKLNAGLYWNI
ncbi:MAG TPA: carboxypeptidase-like regulatory domain-containing protein, partial [Chitinophagaceae bacterium]